mgnify:CR=1 FL=1
MLDDAANIGEKSHVEHAVCFVEHQERHLIEAYRFLFQMVEESSRRGDHDLHSLAQRFGLRLEVDASENRGASERQVFSVLGNRFGNLKDQLSRGRQYERAGRVARRAG